MRLSGFMLLVLCASTGVAWPANPVAAASGVSADLELLEQAANRAIDSLGKTDGYFGNPDVRIPLPGKLEKLRKVMQTLGANEQVDSLVLAMNRAAEAALPQCRALVAASIRQMPVAGTAANDRAVAGADPEMLLQEYRKTMTEHLTAQMLPVVSMTTSGMQVARRYNDLAGKATALGIVEQRDVDLDAYVTRRMLAGLFATMHTELALLRAAR